MRLAEGQVRAVLADRPEGAGPPRDTGAGKSTRVMNAMLQMDKLDLAGLEQVYGASQ
jgi:hypothetical protein